jgi:hypothetical protein
MYVTVDRSIGMRTLSKSLATAALGAACLLLSPAAKGADQAQNNVPSQPATPSTPQQTPIPDQKLGAAAAAMEQVSSLRQTYQQQIAAAPEADKPRLTSEANSALAKAVTDHGLSLDEYNAILQTAQSNPTVRDKLVQHMHPAGP